MKKESMVLVFLNILALLFYLFQWQWTHWTVDDAFIYARIIRNFAEYNVLSFNVSPIASAATSPLFALAAGLLAKTGLDPVVATKALGIPASIVTSWVLYRAAEPLVGSRRALLPAAMFLFLPYVVSFTVSGLETPIYMLVCASALFSVLSQRFKFALICGALASVLRPDGLLVLLVVYMAAWWYTRNLKMLIRWTIPVASILAVYFFAHYLYFGTFLPHSLTAKNQIYYTRPFENFEHYIYFTLTIKRSLIVTHLLALGGLVIGIIRWPKTVWLLIWYVIYYLFFMWRAPMFMWYVVPPFIVTTFFAGIAIALMIEQIESRWPRNWPNWTKVAVSWLPLCGIIVLALPLNYRDAAGHRLETEEFEARIGAVGRWLYDNTQPDDLVFTETLGAIGYYSRNPFVDYPGLVTPDVPAMIVELDEGQAYAAIMETKKPVYVALNLYEWDRMPLNAKQNYVIVSRFPSFIEPSRTFIIARRLSMD